MRLRLKGDSDIGGSTGGVIGFAFAFDVEPSPIEWESPSSPFCVSQLVFAFLYASFIVEYESQSIPATRINKQAKLVRLRRMIGRESWIVYIVAPREVPKVDGINCSFHINVCNKEENKMLKNIAIRLKLQLIYCNTLSILSVWGVPPYAGWCHKIR